MESRQYGGHALLIERDMFARDGIAKFLANLGFSITAVERGIDALGYIGTAKTASLTLVFVHLGSRNENSALTHESIPDCELLDRIAREAPDAAMVVWAENRRCLPTVVQMVSQGGRGVAYLPNSSSLEALATAIDRALSGDVYLHHESLTMQQVLPSASFKESLPPGVTELVPRVASRLPKLSRQELAVAERLCHTTEAIAKDLRLSEHTIRNYLDSVYSKTGLKDPAFPETLFRRDTIIMLAILFHRLETMDSAIDGR